MTINASEYKSVVGVSNLYVAEVLQDDADGYLADTPAYFAPVAEVGAAPAVNSETQYADDAPYDVFVNEGETVLTLTVTGIAAEMLAAVLGKVFDSTTGRVYDTGGTPPEYALGFKSLKSNGSYRYYWYMKGRFSAPEEAFQTKGDTPAPQTTQITFTAVRSTYPFDVGSTDETVKRVWGDEDTTDFSGATWFTQVQTPEVATPSALALSSSTPTDGGTGIVVTSNITLTFNNVLANGALAGCVLMKESTQAAIAVTKSIDSTRKIVTLNPDASLDASTDYDIVIGVTDIYGDTLDAVVNFTTAA
jgi:phi13 family phage major tail protein